MIDKRAIVPTMQHAVLELGCGSRKRHPEAIGVDLLDSPCVDIVGDVFEVLGAIAPASVSQVFSYHFFEHIEDLGLLLDALARVLEPGGRLKIVVPHFSSPFFYSDPTHRTFFGLYTFSYFADDRVFVRQVPKYGRQPQYELVSANLIFKSVPPRYVRHGLKKVVQLAVNASTWMKEAYEELFAQLVPCYEIEFTLERLPSAASR